MDTIYHLAPAARWLGWPADTDYLPAEYAAHGFVHCTAGAALMLQVANRFYRQVPGDFVILALDPVQLTAPLRWEESGDDLAPLFPHIYGPINQSAITGVYAVRRDADGTFLEWGVA